MANNITFKIDADAGNSIKTLDVLNKELEDMKAELRGVAVGSKEFKKLSSEIKSADSQLKNLNKSFEGLDTEALTGEFGKFTGGVTAAFTGIAAMSGGANKSMEAMIQTVAKGMAIAQGFRGAAEAATSATKVWSVVQKVLNKIMNANPIYLIIAAVAILATGLAFLYKAINRTTGEINKYTAATDGAKFATQELADLHDINVKRLETQANKYKILTGALQEYELEIINLNELQKKELEELEKKRKESLDNAIDNELNWFDKLKGFARQKLGLQGATDKQLEKGMKISNELKEQFDKESNKITEFYTKKKAAILERQKKKDAALSEAEKTKKADQIKVDEDAALKKLQFENDAALKKLQFENDIEVRRKELTAATEEEIQLLKQEKWETELELIEEQYGKESELYIEHQLMMAEQQATFDEKEAEIKKAKRIKDEEDAKTEAEKEKKRKEDELKAQKEIDDLSVESSENKVLATAAALGQTARLLGENTTAYKVMASAEALINTYSTISAIIKEWAKTGPWGSIIGGVMAATAGAQGLMTVAKINQVTFAEGGMINGPSHSQGGISVNAQGGESILNAASMAQPSLRNIASAVNVAGGGKDFSTGDGAIMLSSGTIAAIVGGINNKKVYVVETDITETQNKVNVIEQEAIL